MTIPVRLTLHVVDAQGGIEVEGGMGRAPGLWVNAPARVKRGSSIRFSTDSHVLPEAFAASAKVWVRGRITVLKGSKRVATARYQPGLKVQLALEEVDEEMPSQMEPPPLLPDDDIVVMGDLGDITQLEGEVPPTLTMQMPSQDPSEREADLTSVAQGAVALVSDIPPALPDSDEGALWEDSAERHAVEIPASRSKSKPSAAPVAVEAEPAPATPPPPLPAVAAEAIDEDHEEPEPDGLYGSLREMPLLELTQILELSRKTAGIYLRPKDGPNGAVFVADGRVTYAESDDAEGEEAFFRLTECRRGAFRVRFQHTPEYENIDQSTAYLHLEAHRRLDEAKREPDQHISLFDAVDMVSELPPPEPKAKLRKPRRNKSRTGKSAKSKQGSVKAENTRVALAKDASLFSHFFAEVDDEDASASR